MAGLGDSYEDRAGFFASRLRVWYPCALYVIHQGLCPVLEIAGIQDAASSPSSTREALRELTSVFLHCLAAPSDEHTFSILRVTGGGLAAVAAAAISWPMRKASALDRPGSSTNRESVSP